MVHNNIYLLPVVSDYINRQYSECLPITYGQRLRILMINIVTTGCKDMLTQVCYSRMPTVSALSASKSRLDIEL